MIKTCIILLGISVAALVGFSIFVLIRFKKLDIEIENIHFSNKLQGIINENNIKIAENQGQINNELKGGMNKALDACSNVINAAKDLNEKFNLRIDNINKQVKILKENENHIYLEIRKLKPEKEE